MVKWPSRLRNRRYLRREKRRPLFVESLETRVLFAAAIGSEVVESVSVEQRIVTSQPTSQHQTGGSLSEGDFTGVPRLGISTTSGSFLCTGALLDSSAIAGPSGGADRYILTAAHCLTNDVGNVTANNVTATFETDSGNVSVSGDTFYVHPDYDGSLSGGDVAIIELDGPAPGNVDAYDIYRGSDKTGRDIAKVGYGQAATNKTRFFSPSGTKHSGLNQYDAAAQILNTRFSFGVDPGTQLAFDMDNGSTRNDAFGRWFGINDTGVTGTGGQVIDVNSAPGDSGGPNFIADGGAGDGKIIGITSWGFSPGRRSDVDFRTNSSYGEFSIDTDVSFYQSFVTDVVAGDITPASSSAGRSTGGGFLRADVIPAISLDSISLPQSNAAEQDESEPTEFNQRSSPQVVQWEGNGLLVTGRESRSPQMNVHDAAIEQRADDRETSLDLRISELVALLAKE